MSRVLLALAAAAMLCCTAVPVASLAQQVPTPGQTPASSFAPLATPAPDIGPPIDVDDVLAQSREYDNKPVRATGVARDVRTDDTPHGPVLQFELCGHRCVLVLDAGNPDVSENQTATIDGTFYRHLSRGRFSQDDVLLVAPNGLPPDRSQDWRRMLEGRWPPTPAPR
jgi:hypothetical protein